jgi:hypothetical protein
MDTAGHIPVPWWLDHIAVPALFTTLGASLGFVLGRLNDWFDNRKSKATFLKAIRVELGVVRQHLQGTLQDANGAKIQLQAGIPIALHLATAFQTGVYSNQIGKFNDVFDPLVIECIQLHDKLANLEKLKARLTTVSFGLATGVSNQTGQGTAIHYRDTLDEIIKRINQLLPAADSLINKLPK